MKRKLLTCLIVATTLLFGGNMLIALSERTPISQCNQLSNCFYLEVNAPNTQKAYMQLIDKVKGLSGAKLVEESGDFSHWIVKSNIFKFTDDLEILQIPSKNIIQLKSSSQFGLYDFGVNKNRIYKLISQRS